MAARFRKSELKVLADNSTDDHLPCGQKWLTSAFLDPPKEFAGSDPENTSSEEGSDGHNTPPIHMPIPADQ